ncbi:MAG: hypothetical protein ACOC44_18355 [Promethearchaeia archaeon]
MKNTIKRLKSSQFLGKQLSRLKMGQSYNSTLTSTISAISLASIAFQIDFLLLLLIFPVLLLFTHRFLNTNDIKSQEFQLLVAQMLIEAFKNGEDFDTEKMFDKYQDYKKRWRSPEEVLKEKKREIFS